MTFYKPIKQFLLNANFSKWILAGIISILISITLISFINMILFPIVENILQIKDISDLKIILLERNDLAKEANSYNNKELAIKYGAFIEVFISILSIFFSIICAMKFISFLSKKNT